MSSIAGATLDKAQTQLSVSSVVLKKTFEADQKFADAIEEAANRPSAPPPGTGTGTGTGKVVDKSV